MGLDEQGGHPKRAQNLILEERKRLSVSGVVQVLSFDEDDILMDTSLGRLVIRGTELHVDMLSVDSGDIFIQGNIAEIFYIQHREQKGFRARLFG